MVLVNSLDIEKILDQGKIVFKFKKKKMKKTLIISLAFIFGTFSITHGGLKKIKNLFY